MSVIAGVVRKGLQFPAVAKEAVPVWFQMYVVPASGASISGVGATLGFAVCIEKALVCVGCKPKNSFTESMKAKWAAFAPAAVIVRSPRPATVNIARRTRT